MHAKKEEKGKRLFSLERRGRKERGFRKLDGREEKGGARVFERGGGVGGKKGGLLPPPGKEEKKGGFDHFYLLDGEVRNKRGKGYAFVYLFHKREGKRSFHMKKRNQKRMGGVLGGGFF